MADSNNKGTPEETQESENNQTAPVSPETSMDREPTMEDSFTDDEIIITDAEKRAKIG